LGGSLFLAVGLLPVQGAQTYQFTLNDWAIEPASLQLTFEEEDLDGSQSFELFSGELLSFSATYTDVIGSIDWELSDLSIFGFALDPILDSAFYFISAHNSNDYSLGLVGVINDVGIGIISDDLIEEVVNLSQQPLFLVPEPEGFGLIGLLLPFVAAWRRRRVPHTTNRGIVLSPQYGRNGPGRHR